jgi:DNA-binding protein H-NS
MVRQRMSMDIEGLLALRTQVDERIAKARRQLERQLAALGEGSSRASNGRTTRRAKALKGRKVAPKYRSKKDPGLTWAGRGMIPRWMRDEMRRGKLKKEAFLIK